MPRIAGIANFFINGAAAPAKDSLEYEEADTKKDPLYGLNGTLVGYSEEGDAAYIAVSMYTAFGITAGQLYAMKDVQILAQLANGNTVTGHSMNMMEKPTSKNADGSFNCKWLGIVTETPA